MKATSILPAILIIVVAALATAQTTDRATAIDNHLSAIENSPFKNIDRIVEDFENNRFSSAFKSSTTPKARRELLRQIRQIAADAEDVEVTHTENAIVLRIAAGNLAHDVRFAVEGSAPYHISSLDLERGPAKHALNLTLQTLAEQLRELEEMGLSGVISLKIDSKIVHQAAYGFADIANRHKNRLDTIFGVGSRPIDFTVAGVYLLEQRGLLDLDDSIADYFDDVPAEKRQITIRHLLSGQSGLPDFPAQREDWDADLAWIDREEFERRTMHVPLLFSPGEGKKHSHWAFGVAASIIEHVSGTSYYRFLRENFLDPAGMQRTGEYGERRDFSVTDFAVGSGPSFVGLPNIPPNWGPTSWLVKGSGGMYSTIGDLIRFYELIRSGTVLEPHYVKKFSDSATNVDGSMRGFELFSSYDEGGSDEVFLAVNMPGGPNGLFGEVSHALELIISEN